ncbi:hypothetical protein IWQ60_012313 [Tieghemiomyces parasiticus]|uniref:MOSC domain-containing protein n=1 Tax=Tieghemiomyces parasiticus TaxID=78921 RepID=A0A9W8DKQ7_9FUNG|nr:hypothetical protein IWQ60_012313 [Tieghemiomyces parasiticus]
MTQRTESRLVLLQPTIHEHPKDPDTGLPTVPYLAVNVVEQQGPGLPPSTSQNELRVPLYPTDEERARYKLVHVTVFSEKVAGYDLGDEVAEWCSQFLGKPARLVMRADTEVRRMLVCAPPDDLVEEPSQTAFADDAPFLLASEASLHDVNEHLPGYSIDIRRFRPNILVSGCQAFEEETWKRVQFIPDADREAAPETRQADLWVTSRCTRCVMTNNNPDTGMPSSEQQPLKTIIAYRRVDPGAKFKGCFGMNCAPVKLDQMIRVGDAVIVQETGDHCRTSD